MFTIVVIVHNQIIGRTWLNADKSCRQSAENGRTQSLFVEIDSKFVKTCSKYVETCSKIVKMCLQFVEIGRTQSKVVENWLKMVCRN